MNWVKFAQGVAFWAIAILLGLGTQTFPTATMYAMAALSGAGLRALILEITRLSSKEAQ